MEVVSGAAARGLLRLVSMPRKCRAQAWRGMARLSRLAGALALGGTLSIACGARTWLPSDAIDTGDGASCQGKDVPLEPNVPNLYFVLDVSGSMLEDNKWDNVRMAARLLVQQLGASAKFGVTVFPAPGTSECTAGVEVMPLRLGDSNGTTETAFINATAITPAGGTPTAATFRALVPKLRDLPGVTFVILATDGGPNCDASLGQCSADQCTNNIDLANMCSTAGPNCCAAPQGDVLGCLDGTATAAAVSALHDAGVQTYVMGIPGSAPYTAVLDAVAMAGGTARSSEPLYYQVDSPDTTALGAAFGQIAADAMKSCTLLLGRAPSDPNKVNVAVDGTLLPSDGPNGWAIHGQTVTLSGAACGAVRGDTAPTVHVLDGCPTVR